MKVLLATTNPAKVAIYGEQLIKKEIEIVTLKDLNITCDIDESGKDPIENAIIKAKTYYEKSKIPTIAIDDGLFLENLPQEIEPGTHVRRVNNKTLTDEEMFNYYKELVQKYGTDGELKGYYLKGVAVVINNNITTKRIEKEENDFTKKSGEEIGDFLIETLTKKD